MTTVPTVVTATLVELLIVPLVAVTVTVPTVVSVKVTDSVPDVEVVPVVADKTAVALLVLSVTAAPETLAPVLSNAETVMVVEVVPLAWIEAGFDVKTKLATVPVVGVVEVFVEFWFPHPAMTNNIANHAILIP